jgi:integrase
MTNTVKGQIEKLSAMLHKAVLYGYPINNTFSEIKIKEEEPSAIFFDQIEIARLYYFKGLTRFQEQIRDLFIVGCCTGLRYSDYSRLEASHFINHLSQIQIKTIKTGTVVKLPVHRFVKEIWDKYNGSMPKSHCIQYFDRYIKLVCKEVGFDEDVLWERTVGTQVVRKVVKKYELIGSHTARRSFATNTFLAGIQPYRIMLITGHKSEKSFFKYIRITREENAITLLNHKFFQ